MITSYEVEADVLGGMMLASMQGEECAIELAGILGDDAFAKPEHRQIYETVLSLARAEKPHDGLAVAEAMKGSGIPFADIVALMHDTSTLVNIEHRARYLRDLANRRAVIQACHEAMRMANSSPASDVVSALAGKLDKILVSGTQDALHFADVASRAEAYVQDAIEKRKKGRSVGIPFGIPAIDAATGGMRPTELIGIAARTSIGKTALANQIAVTAASRGHRGLILSLEESPEGIGLRAIANRGGINLMQMRSGAVRFDDVSQTVIEHGMNDYPLWVDTNTFDLSAIAARLTQYARKHRIEFAVVDHIGLVRTPQRAGTKRYEAIGEVTRTLKLLAGQLNITVVALIQVGRDSEKESRRPRLSDLRESGNIEQDLNVCIAMHPVGDAQNGGPVPLEVGILKNRYGLRGWLEEKFEFHGSIQDLRQIEYT